MAGVVGGLIVVTTSISYPAVIFTGAFQPYLGTGIEMALFGTAVLSATVALGSSYPAAIANVQIETAVVLGVISAAIADLLGAGAARRHWRRWSRRSSFRPCRSAWSSWRSACSGWAM